MIALSEWMRSCPLLDRPWLILGKGPSFSRRHHVDLSPYYLASLNHVVREMKVDVAHYIDLEALVACADDLPRNADWLLVPRYPHVNFRPSAEPLEVLCGRVPVLRQFAERGRLVWYYHDLLSRPELKASYPPGAGPLIAVDAFSVEALVNVLAVLGVKIVRTLGVDGGIHYSQSFHDLNGTTRLANGQSSFDRQFLWIHRTVKENDMDYGPLHEPIRVYVGTDDSQMAAVRVLEFSIRQFATRPVEVVPLLNLPVPMPRDPANRPRTGFSFARFLIPQLAGYRGRAIYLDADMLVFSDIAELWDLPMESCRVLCSRQDTPPATWQNNAHFQPGRQMSVMLLDCGRLDWKIEDIVRGLDEGRYDYRQLMCDLCIVPSGEIGEAMPPEWNCLEHFEAGKTRLLHYTDMEMQPWRRRNNPLWSIWRSYYRAAMAAGAIEPELIENGIANGSLLPELADDLAHAPSRLAQRPDKGAMAGTATARQRSQDLELAALRAEVGILRSEADMLRHEVHVRGQQVSSAHAQMAGLLEEQCRLLARCASAEQQLSAVRSTWSWKLARGVTKPMRVLKVLTQKRPAA